MRLVALAAALALTACAHARTGGRVVEVEGAAPLDGRGRDDARQRALADARRRAVEEVAGAVVEGRSRVVGAVSRESEVSTRSRGFVESTEILEEAEERGLWRVRVRARVREGAPPLSAVSLRLPAGALADGVARALREKRIEDSPGAPPLMGTARAAALGSSLVAGTTAARARAVLTYGEGSQARTASGEASAIDPDPDIASEKAVEAAGYLAGLALADALAAR